MSHCQFWLVFLAVVLVDGWPRHHHKPKPGTKKKKPLLIAYGKKGTWKSNVSKISFPKVLQNVISTITFPKKPVAFSLHLNVSL